KAKANRDPRGEHDETRKRSAGRRLLNAARQFFGWLQQRRRQESLFFASRTSLRLVRRPGDTPAQLVRNFEVLHPTMFYPPRPDSYTGTTENEEPNSRDAARSVRFPSHAALHDRGQRRGPGCRIPPRRLSSGSQPPGRRYGP